MSSGSASIISLPYVDIQHDALAVFDDVEQSVVAHEDIWISAYQAGETSVHGKARVERGEGGQSTITPRDGVTVERESHTNLTVSVPTLAIQRLSVKFPRQQIKPPYSKSSALTPELTVNALAYSQMAERLLVAGPDGYLAAVSTSRGASTDRGTVMFKGHVGDVLSVCLFPSGQVALSTSSDLSVRIWSMAGENPRTLTGHTRAVTCTAILGVGKQVASGSKDGTVRLWHVGEGREVRKWETHARAPLVGIHALGPEDRDILALDQSEQETWVLLVVTQDGSIEILGSTGDQEAPRWRIPPARVSTVVTTAYDAQRRVLALGHTDGVVQLRHLSTSRQSPGSDTTNATAQQRSRLIRRNESPISALAWHRGDLLVGTEAGLPFRLSVQVHEQTGELVEVAVKEELAGWEPMAISSFAVQDESVWCAGGDVVARY